MRAGVSPANVDRAVASIDEEVTRLARDGLTPKELDESRRYLIGAMPRSLETNAASPTSCRRPSSTDWDSTTSGCRS